MMPKEDSDPSYKYVPNEKFTSTEDEMAEDEFNGMYKVSPPISQCNLIFSRFN